MSLVATVCFYAARATVVALSWIAPSAWLMASSASSTSRETPCMPRIPSEMLAVAMAVWVEETAGGGMRSVSQASPRGGSF